MTLKEIILCPFMIIPLIAYKTSSFRDRLEKDIDKFWIVHFGLKPKNYYIGIVRELINCIEFRNLFFFRCG